MILAKAFFKSKVMQDNKSNFSGEPKKSSKIIKWILIVLLIIAIAVAGYFGYTKYQQQSQEITQLQSQVKSLQEENAKLKALAKASAQKAESADEFFVIKEWDVKFKPADKLTGLAYAIKEDMYSYFSTTSLMSSALTADKPPNIGSYCDVTGGAIGAISRGKKGEEYQAGQMYEDVKDAKKIGDYYYVVGSPQSTCSNDKATADLQTAQIKLLKTSFASLESAK